MALTLSQMETRVNRYLENVGGLHWTSAEIIDLINEQRRDLWQHVRRINPWALGATETDYTWSGQTLSVDASGAGVLNETDFEILLISVLPSSASAKGYSNQPYPLRRIPFEEVFRHRAEGPIYSEALTAATAWSGDGITVSSWAMEGVNLYLSPVPASDVRLLVRWVTPWTDLIDVTDDANPVIPATDPVIQRYDLVVLYGAIIAAKGRSDESTQFAEQQYGARRQQLEDELREREQTGTARIQRDGY